MRFVYGTYTGDGVDDRAIDASPLGGALKWLCVQRASADAVMRFDLGGDLSFPGGASSGSAGLIKSLDAGGFTLGADAKVNATGVAYHYYGLVDTGDGDLVTGSYVGNATDNRDITSGLGATAAFSVVRGDTAYWRSADMSGDLALGLYAGSATDAIQSVGASGFQVGTRCNASGVAYYYVSTIAVAGVLATLSYTGDVVADRAITGAGFDPDFATAQQAGGAEAYRLTATMAAPTALSWLGHTYTNGVKSLISDGFTVGNHAVSNGSGTTYYALCMRDNVVLLTPTTASNTDTATEAVVDVALNVGGASPTTTSAEAVVGITIGLGGVSAVSTSAEAVLLVLTTTPDAAILASLEAGRYALLHEIDLPNGTVLRSSMGGCSSLIRGHYKNRVLTFGTWRVGYSVDAPAGTEFQVEMADTDGALATLIRGRYQRELEGGVACRLLLAPLDGASTWLLAWQGVTVRPEIAKTNVVRFGGRVDDRAMRVPSPTRLVGPSWPFADADVRELPAPAVYGLHDGGALGLATGQVRALRVDSIAKVWAVSGGAAKSVARAYDDTGQIALANYAAAVSTQKGASWHTLTFTSTPTGEVSVDLSGVEDAGDGSGTLITNAAEQIAHYLSNRVLGQATTGWLSTNPRLDAASLAAIASWLDSRLYSSDGPSYYRVAAAEAYSVLREWQESLEVYAWWQADGSLAFGVWPGDEAPYFEDLVLRWPTHDLDGKWAPSADDRKLVTGLRARHAPSAVSGGYLATLDVVDPEAERSDVDELPMPWSCAG